MNGQITTAKRKI